MLIEIVHFEQIKALPRTWNQDLEQELEQDLGFFYDFPAPPAAEDPSPSPHRPVSPPTMRESLTGTHAHTHTHTRTPAHTIDFNTPRLSSFGKKGEAGFQAH